MNEDVLSKLKHYLEDNETCQHIRTHASYTGARCDDCPALWCYSCNRLHVVPIGLGCEFSRLLNDNARDLIGLAQGSQRAVQEFIDAHHNPFVAFANKMLDHQHKQILLLEDGLREARQDLKKKTQLIYDITKLLQMPYDGKSKIRT